MSVFTVYFCGTGSDRFDDSNPDFWNGELVATLASNTQGREFADWIAIDGPGSGNLQQDELFVEGGGYFNITGQLFGNGWEENVLHALQVVKGSSNWERTKLSDEQYERLKQAGVPVPEPTATGSWFWRTYDYGDRKVTPQALQEQIITQFRKQLIPTQVNLVGWSRGGISCHMLANAMAQDPELKDVPVRIFAIDPVPGVGNLQAHRTQLAGNVREYVGFFSRDERSKGFACVIPGTDPSTRIHVFPLPGRHATLVGNASEDGTGGGKVFAEPGQVVRHFAEVCLTRWGVTLAKRLQLSDQQLMACHTCMAEDDERYRAMRSASYTLLTESQGEERFVHEGNQGKAFSEVRGGSLDPSEGLSVEQWHADSYRPLC